MDKKFANVPEDSGTQIILETEVKFGEFDVLFQHWIWDGIEAESIIFVASDVAHLSDDELLGQVEDSAINTVKSGLTIKRNTHGYTFINLNFKAIEDEDDEPAPAPLTPEEQKRKSIAFRQYVKSRNEREIENLKSTMLHNKA